MEPPHQSRRNWQGLIRDRNHFALDLIINLAQVAILAKERGMEAVFANYECHERRTLNRERVYGIPLSIMRIKNPKETGIRAVIVVEHRSLADNFALVQDILGTGMTRHLDMIAVKYICGTRPFLLITNKIKLEQYAQIEMKKI